MTYAFGEFELDDERYELRRRSVPVKIQPKPFRALLYLIRHRDGVVSKDELMAALWPAEMVSESSLTFCMWGVRHALGKFGTTAVKTLHRLGYRFVAPVAEGRRGKARAVDHDEISQAGALDPRWQTSASSISPPRSNGRRGAGTRGRPNRPGPTGSFIARRGRARETLGSPQSRPVPRTPQ
jgi:DNA-binding winged helix-turn-helix (wHTH) protein